MFHCALQLRRALGLGERLCFRGRQLITQHLFGGGGVRGGGGDFCMVRQFCCGSLLSLRFASSLQRAQPVSRTLLGGGAVGLLCRELRPGLVQCLASFCSQPLALACSALESPKLLTCPDVSDEHKQRNSTHLVENLLTVRQLLYRARRGQ